MNLIGYTTKREAKSEGMTHHGFRYFVPVWMGESIKFGGIEVPNAKAKFKPFEYLIDALDYLQVRMAIEFDLEPNLEFKRGKKI